MRRETEEKERTLNKKMEEKTPKPFPPLCYYFWPLLLCFEQLCFSFTDLKQDFLDILITKFNTLNKQKKGKGKSKVKIELTFHVMTLH